MNKIILDLCGGTGAWSKPYKDAGYDVRVITLPEHDIRYFCPPQNVYGILAAPPCTMFSIARNDATAKEKRDFLKGMEIVQHCLRIIWQCRSYPLRNKDNSLKFWSLENPKGYLRWFLGKPALTFNPFEYGDPYTKATDLWGLFKEPRKKRVKPERHGKTERTFVKEVESFYHMKKHQIPKDYKKKTRFTMRNIVRSITPEGFAKAFYEANK